MGTGRAKESEIVPFETFASFHERAEVVARDECRRADAAHVNVERQSAGPHQGVHPTSMESLLARARVLHGRMWRAAIAGAQGDAMEVVLPAINEVIDLHSTHLALARRHLPLPIMSLLLGTAAIGVALLGFGNGRAGRRFTLLDSIYGIALVVALWMTIDLDHPGTGFIQVSNRSVVETLAAMN